MQKVVLGLYIIKGDNISLVGEVDPDLEASTDFDLGALRSIFPSHPPLALTIGSELTLSLL